eukprot:302962-Pelagomonas_calceolata.AAC.2
MNSEPVHTEDHAGPHPAVDTKGHPRNHAHAQSNSAFIAKITALQTVVICGLRGKQCSSSAPKVRAQRAAIQFISIQSFF